jgi:hypothetical protein
MGHKNTNAPQIVKEWDIIFLPWDISRDFSRGRQPFENCAVLLSGPFGGQKGLNPLKKYLEKPHYVFFPRKNISCTFRISGTLTVIKITCL